jgi:hypothetical protein
MDDTKDQYFGLIIVIALFLIPVVISVVRKKLFGQFSLAGLVKVLNWAFIVQFIFGIILYVVATILDRNDPFMMDRLPAGYKVNHFDIIFFGVAYVFLVIGAFMYLPALIVLNIVNWAIMKFKKK